MRVPVYVQERHIHLSQIDADKLFGKGYVFFVKKKFTQPCEFIAKETIDIKGPNGEIKNLNIILPFRKFTQVEIYNSDNQTLGIKAQITPSGELKSAEPITIIGPNGNIYLQHSAIIAQKHIHMSVAQAKDFGFRNNQKVNIKTHGENPQIIERVRIRTNDKYDYDFHINLEEGQKLGLSTNDRVEIITE